MSRRAGMFGSEAALVKIDKVILSTTLATADSGPTCLEGKDWRNWQFSVEIPFGSTFPAGLTVTWYGSSDPQTVGTLPGTPTPPPYSISGAGGSLAVTPTASNWFKIPAEAIQTGTGVEANPIVAVGQSLSYDRPVRAVRAVVAGNTPGNTVNCRVAAVP